MCRRRDKRCTKDTKLRFRKLLARHQGCARSGATKYRSLCSLALTALDGLDGGREGPQAKILATIESNRKQPTSPVTTIAIVRKCAGNPMLFPYNAFYNSMARREIVLDNVLFMPCSP